MSKYKPWPEGGQLLRSGMYSLESGYDLIVKTCRDDLCEAEVRGQGGFVFVLAASKDQIEKGYNCREILTKMGRDMVRKDKPDVQEERHN